MEKALNGGIEIWYNPFRVKRLKNVLYTGIFTREAQLLTGFEAISQIDPYNFLICAHLTATKLLTCECYFS